MKLTELATCEHCKQSTCFTNLTVVDPAIIQRIRTFHSDLTALRNTLCNVCLEWFPSIKTNEAGVCNQCQSDNEVPILYSAAKNQDPGPVPLELCTTGALCKSYISSVKKYCTKLII